MMRADSSVVLTPAIAVVAHQSIARFGPTQPSKGSGYARSPKISAVLSAATILVIYREKPRIGFSAAYTLAPICRDHQGTIFDIAKSMPFKNCRLVLVVVIYGSASYLLGCFLWHARSILTLTHREKLQILLSLFFSAFLLTIFTPQIDFVESLLFGFNLFKGEHSFPFSHSGMLAHSRFSINWVDREVGKFD